MLIDMDNHNEANSDFELTLITSSLFSGYECLAVIPSKFPDKFEMF